MLGRESNVSRLAREISQNAEIRNSVPKVMKSRLTTMGNGGFSDRKY